MNIECMECLPKSRKDKVTFKNIVAIWIIKTRGSKGFKPRATQDIHHKPLPPSLKDRLEELEDEFTVIIHTLYDNDKYSYWEYHKIRDLITKNVKDTHFETWKIDRDDRVYSKTEITFHEGTACKIKYNPKDRSYDIVCNKLEILERL